MAALPPPLPHHPMGFGWAPIIPYPSPLVGQYFGPPYSQQPLLVRPKVPMYHEYHPVAQAYVPHPSKQHPVTQDHAPPPFPHMHVAYVPKSVTFGLRPWVIRGAVVGRHVIHNQF